MSPRLFLLGLVVAIVAIVDANEIVMYQPTIINIPDSQTTITYNVSTDQSRDDKSLGFYIDLCSGPAVVVGLSVATSMGLSSNSTTTIFDYDGKGISQMWTSVGFNDSILSPVLFTFKSKAYDNDGLRVLPTIVSNTKLQIYVGDSTNPRPSSMFPPSKISNKGINSACTLDWSFTPPLSQFRNGSYLVYSSSDVFAPMTTVCSIQSGTLLGSMSVSSTIDQTTGLSFIRIYGISAGTAIGVLLRTSDGRSEHAVSYVVPLLTCSTNSSASLNPAINPSPPSDTSSNRDHTAVIVLSVFLSLSLVALCLVVRRQKTSRRSDAFVHLTAGD